MKRMLALAAASGLLAFAAPALAQDAMTPGAAGVSGSATGSNTGTSPDWNSSYDGYYAPRRAPYARGTSTWHEGSEYTGGYNDGGYNYGGIVEGRAAAPDFGPPPPSLPSQPDYAPGDQGFPQPGIGGGIDNQQ